MLLLQSSSNNEIHSNGKIFIKSLGVYLKGRGEVQIEVYDENNILINTFPSIKSCAVNLNISERSLIRKLDNNGLVLFGDKKYFVKRLVSLPGF